MKGISLPLIVVITAIVVMVVAMIVLTMFGRGVTPVASMAEAKSICNRQCSMTCATTGSAPPDWNKETIKLPDGSWTTCQTAAGDCTC